MVGGGSRTTVSGPCGDVVSVSSELSRYDQQPSTRLAVVQILHRKTDSTSDQKKREIEIDEMMMVSECEWGRWMDIISRSACFAFGCRLAQQC